MRKAEKKPSELKVGDKVGGAFGKTSTVVALTAALVHVEYLDQKGRARSGFIEYGDGPYFEVGQ